MLMIMYALHEDVYSTACCAYMDFYALKIAYTKIIAALSVHLSGCTFGVRCAKNLVVLTMMIGSQRVVSVFDQICTTV